MQIVDILKEHDRSSEPVTHFPSKLPSPPLVQADAIAVHNPPDTDLDTWDDSNMSSDEDVEDKIDNRLVKSKVKAEWISWIHGLKL